MKLAAVLFAALALAALPVWGQEDKIVAKDDTVTISVANIWATGQMWSFCFSPPDERERRSEVRSAVIVFHAPKLQPTDTTVTVTVQPNAGGCAMGVFPLVPNVSEITDISNAINVKTLKVNADNN